MFYFVANRKHFIPSNDIKCTSHNDNHILIVFALKFAALLQQRMEVHLFSVNLNIFKVDYVNLYIIYYNVITLEKNKLFLKFLRFYFIKNYY